MFYMINLGFVTSLSSNLDLGPSPHRASSPFRYDGISFMPSLGSLSRHRGLQPPTDPPSFISPPTAEFMISPVFLPHSS